MSIGGSWRDPEHHAERHQRNGRAAAAADESERARRARRIVAQARSMLRSAPTRPD
jgi:hypothetical protein